MGETIFFRKEALLEGQENPFCLRICIGNIEEMVQFMYIVKEKKINMSAITFGGPGFASFSANTLIEAEKIVISYCTANKKEILPLYKI